MDVIVVGLGAMGSAAAQHLAERGHRVRGIDQFTPPHAHGSSHGLTRIFRQAYFEDHRYVPLLVRAMELWRRLERDTGERLLELPGGLVIGPRDGELVRRSAESAGQFNLAHELLDAKELMRRYPVFQAGPEMCALREENAGYLRPELCVEQQLRQAARAGAELLLDERVLDWEAGPGGVRVRTTRGAYQAERLVVSAGPWAPRMLAEMGVPLRVTRQVLCWFAPEGGVEPFREDRLPVFLIEGDAGERLIYGFPLTGPEGEGVKVAFHGSDEVCSPETICREIRASDEQSVRERLEQVMPTLAGRLLRAETCLYTMTPDEHFVIGPHPEHPAVTVAAGFSGHGFKFAQAIGEMISEMVSGERSEFALFSPQRFAGAELSL